MHDANPKPSRARRAACVVVLFACGGSAFAQGAAGNASQPAATQVYKCSDARGQVTYQQEPCSGGTTGGPVQLIDALKVRPAGDEALWSAAAKEGKPLVGMPKPFVIAASGEPREIRAPKPGEGGSEVWVYMKGAQVTRIGFAANGVVAWIRSDAVAADASAAAGPTAALAAARPADRRTRVREALAVGRECTAALAEAGPADREESLAVGGVAGSGKRYIYSFDAANPNAYAAFVCIGGRVTAVERYVPGQ
jgi:hypothetical protein